LFGWVFFITVTRKFGVFCAFSCCAQHHENHSMIFGGDRGSAGFACHWAS
jgi:hypothetical protein